MIKPRMIGLRIYLCTSGILSSAVLLQGGTNVFSVQDYTARGIAALLLLTVCVLGILDAFVNDVLSDCWRIEWSQSWRHDGYLALAVANLSLIFVAASRDAGGEYLLRFALDGVMATYVAFRDIQLRFLEPRKESQKHADHRA